VGLVVCYVELRVLLTDNCQCMDLVILDIDGTLTDTEHVDDHSIVGALEDVLGVQDLSTDWSTYRTSTDAGIVAEVIERVQGVVDAAVVEAVTRRFYAILEDHYTSSPDLFAPLEGARDVLQTLQRMGYDVAIATGCWRESALFKLRVAGIEHISIPMATADDSPNRTAIVARAIELARRWNDVQAYDRIWYVGDGIWDVQASLELGLAFIGVAGETKAERLRTAGATLVVEHPADVPGLFSPRPVRQTV